MKIVIEIPDWIYEKFGYEYSEKCLISKSTNDIILDAFCNGTPLPKGCGRLGDLDKIWSELKELEEHYQAEFLKESNVIHESAMNGRLYGFTNAKFIVQNAPTIIEADRGGEHE